ncbi:hypothetical protein [Myxococcus eversor]|uniref:hypothetical protein n=1 Tax=Myxococcus eversor TaxID=2709661 RepID=UPI0019679DF6|nr:hypothetical protein [Myxococcus eversor]
MHQELPDIHQQCYANNLLLDVSEQHEGRYPLRGSYNEAFPDPVYCPKIADSFSEFLGGRASVG